MVNFPDFFAKHFCSDAFTFASGLFMVYMYRTWICTPDLEQIQTHVLGTIANINGAQTYFNRHIPTKRGMFESSRSLSAIG